MLLCVQKAFDSLTIQTAVCSLSWQTQVLSRRFKLQSFKLFRNVFKERCTGRCGTGLGLLRLNTTFIKIHGFSVAVLSLSWEHAGAYYRKMVEAMKLFCTHLLGAGAGPSPSGVPARTHLSSDARVNMTTSTVCLVKRAVFNFLLVEFSFGKVYTVPIVLRGNYANCPCSE